MAGCCWSYMDHIFSRSQFGPLYLIPLPLTHSLNVREKVGLGLCTQVSF